MKVPKQIISASGLPENEAKHIKYIGKYKGRDAFHYAEPNSIAGFPTIFLYDGGQVEILHGFESLSIISSHVKD